MVLDADDVIHSVAVTDGHPLVLDNIQRRCREGPCFDTATDHQAYRVDDLERESRWPNFVEKALASTPVRSILALPLFREGATNAALNLYGDHAGAVDNRAEATGALVARHLSEAMTAGQRRRTLCRSSARSDAINQAKELLMERFRLDVAQAFALLVQLSKDQNESIEAVARLLVASEHRDPRASIN